MDKHKKGFLLGKFFFPHLGHVYLIESALQYVEELTVLVCSIQSESKLLEHNEKFNAITEYFKNRKEIKFIPCIEELPQYPEEDVNFWDKWMKVINNSCSSIDIVFSSEDYGYEIASRLPKATHIMIDKERVNVQISGTMTRANVMKNYDYIIPTLRPYFNMRVAVMGPESVGKTTLTERLAHHFNTTHAREFGRELCEVKPDLDSNDFMIIASRQERYIKEANEKAYRIMFSDTELLTTNIFFDLYRPAPMPHMGGPDVLKTWIESIRTPFDLYLLLDIDLPSVQDGTRVFLHRRQEHFDIIKNELQNKNLNFKIISGSYEQKFLKSVNLCNKLIENGKV